MELSLAFTKFTLKPAFRYESKFKQLIYYFKAVMVRYYDKAIILFHKETKS